MQGFFMQERKALIQKEEFHPSPSCHPSPTATNQTKEKMRRYREQKKAPPERGSVVRQAGLFSYFLMCGNVYFPMMAIGK